MAREGHRSAVESRTDHMIMHQLAEKLGFGKELSKNYKMQKVKGMDEPVVEDILREINASVWTIGYTGQSPERLKAHMRNMHVFDVKTLRAKGGKDAETGYDLTGDYFGLPWPCWGNPSLKHPGTANLYDTSLHVMDGGGNFRANFGVERNGVNLLAADGSHSKGADLTTGYPEFDHVLLKKLGWWEDLTPEEQKAAEGKNWKTDPSGGIIRVTMKVHGCHPFGNARARAVVVELPRCHSAAPRADLRHPAGPGGQVPHAQRPQDVLALCSRCTPLATEERCREAVREVPDHPDLGSPGRIRGRGRGNPAQPLAGRTAAGELRRAQPQGGGRSRHPQRRPVWVLTPTGARLNVQALETERVGPDTAFMPFHFSGHWQGVDMLASYPEGAAPIVRGEAVNTGTTYGYDSVTMMQETKTTICNIERPEEIAMARMKFVCDAERCIECNACVTACKNEHEVPWGVNRRRVVTLNDGVPGEKSISVACMHCSDAPCMAVCPVNCFYRTDEGWCCTTRTPVSAAATVRTPVRSGAPQFPPKAFGVRGKMDKCTFCAGGPGRARQRRGVRKYGRNRLAEGKLPACAEMCSTKALLVGDGDVVADIFRTRADPSRQGRGGLGLGHRLWLQAGQAAAGRRRQGRFHEDESALFFLIAAAAVFGLAACTEKPQELHSGVEGKPAYDGTGSNFVAPGWKQATRTVGSKS